MANVNDQCYQIKKIIQLLEDIFGPAWIRETLSWLMAKEKKKKKKIGFIYEENHKFSADDKM